MGVYICISKPWPRRRRWLEEEAQAKVKITCSFTDDIKEACRQTIQDVGESILIVKSTVLLDVEKTRLFGRWMHKMMDSLNAQSLFFFTFFRWLLPCTSILVFYCSSILKAILIIRYSSSHSSAVPIILLELGDVLWVTSCGKRRTGQERCSILRSRRIVLILCSSSLVVGTGSFSFQC